MEVYKGTKNSQTFRIIPGLSPYLVECNLIQKYAHSRKTKNKKTKKNGQSLTRPECFYLCKNWL